MMKWLIIIVALVPFVLLSQQVPDLAYDPPLLNPIYPSGDGPIIYIDEGHHNFHTLEGRYAPFAKVLRKDGYQVKSNKKPFDEMEFGDGSILVIANALHESNKDSWALPNPSAFTDQEIQAIKSWIFQGGRLFLIADHMPWPGAAEELASVFGFTFYNGFNIDIVNPAFFWASSGTIAKNIISLGRNEDETVHKIPRTEGQAFQIPPDAQPILIFDETCMMLMPDTAWVFHEHTPLKNISGYVQGAFKEYGNGRIVVFGEASLFTAQIGEPGQRKMGMNSEGGKDNYKLLLNSIHWLDGKL